MTTRLMYYHLPKLLTSLTLRKPMSNKYFSNHIMRNDTFLYPAVSVSQIDFTRNIITRKYGKSKDKGKDKKKGSSGKVEINTQLLSAVINLDKFKIDLQSNVDMIQESFVQNVSLRSTTGSIESLSVNFEGNKHELQELAQISRKNPKTVILNMATFPQAITAVLEAIRGSGLNLNPQQDGTTLYIPIPKVTKEHRENLAKNAKILYVKHCTRMKDLQNEQLKKAKKSTGISEDDLYSANKQIAAITEEYLVKIRKVYDAKIDELLKTD